jgi:pimeloyl-ACP methyl ester carboxylesterase
LVALGLLGRASVERLLLGGAVEDVQEQPLAVAQHRGLTSCGALLGCGWWRRTCAVTTCLINRAASRPIRRTDWQLDRLALLNVPHSATVQRGFRSARQVRKSWYMFYFPLPEATTGSKAMCSCGGRSARVFQAERSHRKTSIAMSARCDACGEIDAPVLVIWGEQDRYIGRELASPTPGGCPMLARRLEGTSQWVDNDQAARVNRLLTDFLGR